MPVELLLDKTSSHCHKNKNDGIREVLPIVLDDTERRQLAASAAALKDVIRQLGC
jgi:malate/lactate dehydrogenase